MEGKTLLRSILDAFEDGVCLLDEAGAVRCMNAAAEELTGYREEELFGHSFLPNVEIAHESGDPGFDAEATSDRPRTPPWIGVQIRRKDGGALDVVCARRPLGQAGAGPTLLKFHKREREPVREPTFQDIKAELGAIFGTMPDGADRHQRRRRHQLFSSGAESLFGYRAEEALGKNVKMLMPSPYREAHDGYLADYRNTGVKKIIGVGREVSGRRKDGSTFPMYLSIGEIWLEGRRYFVGVTHDLTRLKRAEERLLTLSAAVEQSPTAVMISNKEGRIEYVNSRFRALDRLSRPMNSSARIRVCLQSNHTEGDQYRRFGRRIRSRRRMARRNPGSQEETANSIGRWKPLRRCATRRARSPITWPSSRTSPNKSATRRRSPKANSVSGMSRKWPANGCGNRTRTAATSIAAARCEDMLGLAPEEILGKTYLDFFDRG